jgi:alkanesulfonate monooxygenase SsuD/methylene tetrahydromethanopterin reductase-like flavin-dependent oxidoreductase (luciferase family)
LSAPLGVALTAHWLPLDALVRLARRADELGYAQLLVDGDSGIAAPAPERPIYDPTALAAAVALATKSIRIGQIHVAHFWNPVLLARSLATLQELSNGRLVAVFGVGAQRATARLGLPEPDAGERVTRLDETVGAVRALLGGESTSARGRFVSLERVNVTRPSRPIPIAISAAGPRALAAVRRHADIWDANVPPLRERFEPLRAALGRELPTWLWVFARPGAAREAALAAYRRHAPWFADLSPDDAARAVLFGEPARCRAELERIRGELGLALPIADLSGLDETSARSALEALAPASVARIS